MAPCAYARVRLRYAPAPHGAPRRGSEWLWVARATLLSPKVEGHRCWNLQGKEAQFGHKAFNTGQASRSAKTVSEHAASQLSQAGSQQTLLNNSTKGAYTPFLRRTLGLRPIPGGMVSGTRLLRFK